MTLNGEMALILRYFTEFGTAGTDRRANMRYLSKFRVTWSNRCGYVAAFCAKFGAKQHCSFEDTQFSLLCKFGLKCLFTPFFGVLLG